MISIHAPRVGSDDIAEQCYNIAKLNFNPRSPCGERPSDTTVSGRQSSRFQSTLPVWGATSRRWSGGAQGEHFNPRSPCGERRQLGQRPAHSQPEFQSTLPVWGATGHPDQPAGNGHISIHAPRVGSDNLQVILDDNVATFQSTLPVWGATKDKDNLVGAINISIHAPRVGSDANVIDCYYRRRNFNPRSPCGERPNVPADRKRRSDFNPRSPCGERPPPYNCWPCRSRHFNPRSPCGERRDRSGIQHFRIHISIHAPRVGSDKSARRLLGRSV